MQRLGEEIQREMGKGKKRHSSWKMQALTSTISTTMVLVLLGIVTITMLTARTLSRTVREDLTVTVILEDGTETEEAKKLQAELAGEPYVAHVNYISPEQALAEQIESMGVEPTEFLGENPFSISMELRMTAEYACNDSLNWITSGLKAKPNVADVIYQKDLVESLNRNLKRISLALLAVAMLLVVVSLVLINNTVRLSVFSHRFTIHTMKLVGARWGIIRRPFLRLATFIGLASATLADGMLIAGCKWAESYDSTVATYVTTQSLGIMTAILYGTGLVITLACTYLSVTSALRKKESDLY
ncbi:permease-like cell division protein FtsX [bacterium]|nr:permease-like cell division protein FtsX [bacterium]